MKKKSLFMATLATISASGALFATSANANAAMDHKIVLNDTLWGLSKKYNVTIDALKKYNKLSSDTIYVGDTLKVPTKAAAPRWKEPVSLRLPDGRTFPLRFDCQRCEMQVLKP